jgi:uncharacterized protein (DUF924 family)
MMHYQNVLSFWFEDLTPADWFAKSDGLDARISARFADTHRAAAACELYHWRRDPLGRLAEIIVLDQFSRNIFRGQPAAFSSDPLALGLAQELIAQAHDQAFSVNQKCFAYLPFMHSEALAIHDVAVQLFSVPGLEDNLKFEHAHRAIIERFGRYPHRNAILGRASTPDELAFLAEPGSSF